MKDYGEVQEDLLAMLGELNERLGKITDDVKHSKEPPEKDFAEQAIEMENYEVLDHLGNAARMEISQIKQALERIEKGLYGECSVCGEPINEERLKALPYSDKCIRCAEKES